MRWSVMIFFSVMILGGCNREPSSVRTADGYIYPQVPFDVSTAQAMLQPGECELRGTAVAKEADRTPIMIVNLSTGHDAPPGTLVILYPRTAYLDDWVLLRRRYGRVAVLSQEAHALRREVQCGANGEFIFPNVGPGSYYLEAIVPYVQETEETLQTGTDVAVYTQTSPGLTTQHVVETPTYTRFTGSYNARKLTYDTVEIDAMAKSATVSLRN
jgi:hypothetical protein